MNVRSVFNFFLGAAIFVVITICYILGTAYLIGPGPGGAHNFSGIGRAFGTILAALILAPPTSIIAYKKLRIESKTSEIYYPIAFCATALAIIISLPLLEIFGAGVIAVIGLPTIIGLIIGRKLSEKRE